jgi:hypothetical protein
MKYLVLALLMTTSCIHTPPPPTSDNPGTDAGQDPLVRDLSRDPGASPDVQDAELDVGRDVPRDMRPEDQGVDAPQDTPPDMGADTSDAPCPPGVFCADTFPFTHTWSTLLSVSRSLDGYSCMPEVSERGPEVLYRVTVEEAGFLSAAVYDDDADIDVHILTDIDAAACIARGHHHAGINVEPGVYWVVADTWSDDVEHAGEYRIDIGLTIPSEGPCGMETGFMDRVRDGGERLAMPATGPIVLEAHLVTQDEPPPYPTTSTEELPAHYAHSQSVTGFVMFREQLWAPLEGGDFYGAGIGTPTVFPAAHEAWYVNMFWTRDARPDRGARMILRIPGTSRAVVVAAGYETGPGNLDHIGGTPEETHFYLGTGHLDTATLGIATDQRLPLGPRVCTD